MFKRILTALTIVLLVLIGIQKSDTQTLIKMYRLQSIPSAVTDADYFLVQDMTDTTRTYKVRADSLKSYIGTPDSFWIVLTADSITTGTFTGLTFRIIKTGYGDTTSGYWVGLDGGVPKMYIGNGTDFLKWTGTQLQVNNATIDGSVFTDIATGSDINIMGWTTNIVYTSYAWNRISWTAGWIKTPSDSFAIALPDSITSLVYGTRHYIYFDADSPTTLSNTTNSALSVGRNKILLCVVEGGVESQISRARFQTFGGTGGIFLGVENLVANTASVNEFVSNTANIKDAIITNAKISSITADKITSGLIKAGIVLADSITGGDITGLTFRVNKTSYSDNTAGAIIDSTGKVFLGDGTNYLKWTGTALDIHGSGKFTGSSTSPGYVYIQPDDEVGLKVTTQTGRVVFSAKNGGTDIGDVQIGIIGSGYGLKWDNSDSTLKIRGDLQVGSIDADSVTITNIDATNINAGTFTGLTFQTAATGKRIVVSADSSTLKYYNAAGESLITIDDNIVSAKPGMRIVSTSGGVIYLKDSDTGLKKTYLQDGYIQVMATAGGTVTLTDRIVTSSIAGSKYVLQMSHSVDGTPTGLADIDTLGNMGLLGSISLSGTVDGVDVSDFDPTGQTGYLRADAGVISWDILPAVSNSDSLGGVPASTYQTSYIKSSALDTLTSTLRIMSGGTIIFDLPSPGVPFTVSSNATSKVSNLYVSKADTSNYTATAGTATTATNATNSNITAESTTNSVFYPTFVTATSGNRPISVDAGLTYNPFSGTLTSTTFVGALTGNASSATSATTATTASSLSSTLGIASGGTGATSKSTAFDALSPMSALGDIIYGGTSGSGTRLAVGTSSQVLIGGSIPAWGSVPAHNQATSTITSGDFDIDRMPSEGVDVSSRTIVTQIFSVGGVTHYYTRAQVYTNGMLTSEGANVDNIMP